MILTRRLVRILLFSTLFLPVVGTIPLTILAHEGGPQVVVDARQFAPGESVEIRGGNIGTDLVVGIELAADGKVIPLGETVCDGHGDFTQTFVLPADLSSGVYTLQVVDPSVPGAEVVVASTQLSVQAGSSRLLGSSAVLPAGLLALVVVVLTGAWFLRMRRQVERRKSQ